MIICLMHQKDKCVNVFIYNYAQQTSTVEHPEGSFGGFFLFHFDFQFHNLVIVYNLFQIVCAGNPLYLPKPTSFIILTNVNLKHSFL